MLTAYNEDGNLVMADYDMPRTAYWCRECGWEMVPRLGEVITPHFAHAPENPDECSGSTGESIHHDAAKRWVANWLTGLGCTTGVEVVTSEGRRLDVGVKVPPGLWGTTEGEQVNGRKFAIEIQSSPIFPLEIRQRNVADMRAGFAGTVWMVLGDRAQRWASYLHSLELGIPFTRRSHGWDGWKEVKTVGRVEDHGHILDSCGAMHVVLRHRVEGGTTFAVWQVRAQTSFKQLHVTDFDHIGTDPPVSLKETVQGGRRLPALGGNWLRTVPNMFAVSKRGQRLDAQAEQFDATEETVREQISVSEVL